MDVTDIEVKSFNLPKKYAVIPTGFTAEVREMIPEAVNGLSKWLNKQAITPVYLGKSNSPLGSGKAINPTFKEGIDYSLGLDLRDQTDLLQSAKIISNAEVIIGLDNGLLHLAGMTQTPIVAGFTTLTPEHRIPYRHNTLGWKCSMVVPDQRLTCRFCQSNTHFILGHDYRKCFYEDYVCTKSMTADVWIEATKKLMEIK